MAQYQMSAMDKEKLVENRIYLLDNLVPSEKLLSYLFGKMVLTENMYQEIKLKELHHDKTAKLLEILPRRGPEAFQHFVDALTCDGQAHIANLLKEEKHPKISSVDEENGVFNPEVIKIDQHQMKLIKDTEQQECYRMSSKPRGHAIIINNTYFINTTPRRGAENDLKNLDAHLKQLLFHRVKYCDLTAEQMKNVFIVESTRDHGGEDCIIAFILTHGCKGYVYGTDGRKVSIEDDIVAPLCGDRCPSLAGKPKIFFIQACQGESATEGVKIQESDSLISSELKDAIESLRIVDTDVTRPRLPSSDDTVLAYSTVAGYLSWRRTDLGSWFVRAIIKVFAELAYKEDLLSLLAKVRKTVLEYEEKSEMPCRQLTRTDDRTTKKIYFFPGYFDDNRASDI